MRKNQLTHAVFDKNGDAFIAGHSRRDCLLQLIGTDTPDALLDSVWQRDWAAQGFTVRAIKPIRPVLKTLSGYEKSPDYGGGESWGKTSGTAKVLALCLGAGLLFLFTARFFLSP